MSYPSQPGYPQPQGPGAYPYPTYVIPVKTSTKGPRWMTFVGVFLLVVAVAAAVVAVQAARGIIVFDGKGKPSSSVILAVEAGESGEASLAGDTEYGIWLNGRTETRFGDETCSTSGGLPEVAGPDQASVSMSSVFGDLWSWSGEHCAVYRWEFTTSTAGTYQVDAPDGATVFVTKSTDPNKVLGGVGLGALTALGAGATGLGLTIAGAIWWRKRSKAARRVGSAPPGVPSLP